MMMFQKLETVDLVQLLSNGVFKMVDYDEYECEECGHVGVLPNGGMDYECPVCGYEGSFESDKFDDTDEEGA